MAKKRLKMTKKAIAARRRYKKAKGGKKGGAILGAHFFGPLGWLLPF